MNTLTRSLTLLALAGATLPVLAAPSTPNYHQGRKISLPGPVGWDYMLMDSAARRLYVSRGTHVTVIDVDKGTVAGDIPNTDGVHGIAIDPKTGHGFTSDGRANAVTMFDTKTLKTLATIPVGQGPDCIIFDPSTERVFTFNGEAQTATAIDAVKGTVVGTVTLPGRPEFAVADGKGEIYDNIESLSEVAAINARTLTVDHTWPVAPGDGPSGIAMDTKNRRLFSVCGNKQMVVMDADTGKVVATPAIGNGPDACAYDPNMNIVFSPNGRDGTMTVLREVTPDQYQTLATVPTQAGARTMALDLKTNDFFTVTATPLPAVAGTPPWRRQYAPDSFVVLQYAP